jgi:hypothetical protein
LHFDDLVGDETVPLSVNANRRLFVRSLDQAEDLARSFVEPLLTFAMHVLCLEVLLMGAGAAASHARTSAVGAPALYEPQLDGLA